MNKIKQNNKRELIILCCTTTLMLILMVYLLFTINNFSKSYENCKDDFRVIEKCGCLPFEGNYEFFYGVNDGDKELNKKIIYDAYMEDPEEFVKNG